MLRTRHLVAYQPSGLSDRLLLVCGHGVCSQMAVGVPRRAADATGIALGIAGVCQRVARVLRRILIPMSMNGMPTQPITTSSAGVTYNEEHDMLGNVLNNSNGSLIAPFRRE